MNQNPRFDRWTLLGLVAVVALLVVNAGLSYRNSAQLAEDARWVAHTHEVIETLERVHGHVRGAESAQRTYLVTGGDAVPTAFTENVAAAERALERVKGLTGDNPDQQARVPEVEGRLRELTAGWSRTRAVRKEQGFEAARRDVLAGGNDARAGELAGLIGRMQDTERELLRDRQTATERAYTTAVATGLAAAALWGAVVALFAGLLNRHLRARQRAGAVIHEQRQLLHATLASIGDGVITTDAGGRVTFLNDVAQRLTGWTPGDAAGQPLEEVFRIVNEDTRLPVENPALRALAEGRVVGLANHTILIARDGTEWPLDDSAAPIRDAGGAVTGSVLVFREVSERRRLEREASERLAAARTLASIVESSEEVIIGKSLDGTIRSWNAAAERVLGYTADEAVGRHISLILPADRYAEEEQILARLRAGERVEHVETVRVRKDGLTVPMALTVSPIRDEAGRVVGASKIARDITDRKRVEEHVREARSRLESTLAAGEVGTWEFDVAHNLVRADANLARMFGVTPEQADGGPVEAYLNAVHPNDRNRVSAAIARAVEVGEGYESEYRLLGPGDRVRWVVARGRVERDAAGRATRLPGVVVDITDRESAERAMRASEEKFRTLFETMDEGFCVIELMFDPAGRATDYRFLEVNPAFERHCGLVDPVGKTMRELVPGHDSHWFEIYGRVAATGEPVRLVDRGEAMGGWWWDVHAFRLGGPDSRKVAVLFNDITERKRAEQEMQRIATELSASDRRKDEFLATLAHELRNPLAPLRTGLQLMHMTDDRGAVERARAMMARQLAQLVRLVDDLLDVSRINQGKIELRRERVRLAAVVGSAVETSRPLIEEKGHDLVVVLPEPDLVVDADPTRLAQVLLNLLNNAAKYSEPGGSIRLAAERHGPDVVVSVRDTGIGIAADQLPRVFELFSQVDGSLERSQGGLGIGLTLVRSLVEMHGGRVEARSDGLGKGSELVVRLPVAAAADPVVVAPDPPAPPRSSHRILIVDDNRDGADSLSEMLGLMGNDTRTAYDGEAAVAASAEFLPDVILLDIGLPKLNGYEACRRIRQAAGGRSVVIIAQTGWGAEEDRLRTREAGFDHHMVKPVDPAALMTLLADLAPKKE